MAVTYTPQAVDPATTSGPQAVDIVDGTGTAIDGTMYPRISVTNADNAEIISSANPLPVSVENLPETQPISATSLPLPAGAALEAGGNLAAALTELQSILAALQGTLGAVVAVSNFPATQNVDVLNFPATQPVSAAALPLPAGAATEGGNLAAIKTAVQGTLAVSAAALPLPTGGATAAKQPAPGVAGTPSVDVLSVQGEPSMTPLKVDGSAATQPVSGTVTANAGTGTMATSVADGQNATIGTTTDTSSANTLVGLLKAIKAAITGTVAVAVASLPLPSGASTAAKQPALGTAGTPSADVLTVQGVASMTPMKVDGSGVTQPVSGTVTANAGTNLNTSTLAVESGGHLASLDTKLPAQGQALAAASTPVVLPATQITALTPPAAITGFALETGGNLANIVAVEGAVADAIVAAGATGSLSAKLRRATQGLEDLKTLIVLGAGSAIIGKVGIDQTTPGTTNGVQLLAGTAFAGTVGGTTLKPSATFTRPADTTAYTANDAVCNSTSAPTPMSFTNAARVAAGSGLIFNATLIDEANQTTPGQFNLYLFKASPTATNDNAALAINAAADFGNFIGVIPFSTSYVSNSASGASGSRVYEAGAINLGFALASGTTIYGLLQAAAAYTPVSGEVFVVNLDIAAN